MDTAELLKNAKTLSRSEIERLLHSMRKPKKVAVEKTKPDFFDLKINTQTYRQTISGNDVLKHFMENLIPDVKFMPPHAIKSQIVSLFEMLAEAANSSAAALKWRQKASKVCLINNQEHLFSYITTIATGIKM